jgi:hypothetical protein
MEGRVVEKLWMPLKTQAKGMTRVLDDLDDSVWCTACDLKRAWLIHRLMMCGVDLDLSSSDKPREYPYL